MIDISMDEILKNTVRRSASKGCTNNCGDYDIYISTTPATKKKSAKVRFNYRFKWVKNFNCVTLSRVGNNLFFIFSEVDEDGTAYAVTRKDKSCSTSISGVNAEKLIDLKGYYRFKEYDWTKGKRPIFYISSEEKIHD